MDSHHLRPDQALDYAEFHSVSVACSSSVCRDRFAFCNETAEDMPLLLTRRRMMNILEPDTNHYFVPLIYDPPSEDWNRIEEEDGDATASF